MAKSPVVVIVATRFLFVVTAVLSTPTMIAAYMSGVVSKYCKSACLDPPCNLEGGADALMARIYQRTRSFRQQILFCKPCVIRWSLLMPSFIQGLP